MTDLDVIPRLDVASRRQENQHLIGLPLPEATDVVCRLVAVQSQDYSGAKWGISQRTPGISDAELDRLFDAGAILRTHVMRPTWHFVLPEDIRWLLMLTAPRVHAFNAYYYRKLELDDALFTRSNAALTEALQGGKQLTRTELAATLNSIGISADGPRLAYIIMYAELEGLICSGARQGKQFTYALLGERAPNARTLERDGALAELTKRYFIGHGPAQAADFVWWSGLTATDAKRGIEANGAHLTSEVRDGKTFWFAPSAEEVTITEPLVRLLPFFDEYIVAYRDQSLTLDTAAYPNAPPSQVMSGLVINGQVHGDWRRTFQRGVVRIEVNPFVPLSGPERDALHVEAERYGAFLGMPVEVVLS